MDPFRTRHKDVVFANGGGLRPRQPPPPLFFKAVQACFQEHRTMNKTCTKHKIVFVFSKLIIEAVCFQLGRCVLVVFMLRNIALGIILPAKSRHKDVVFANGGGGCPPNPAFFPRMQGSVHNNLAPQIPLEGDARCEIPLYSCNCSYPEPKTPKARTLKPVKPQSPKDVKP